MVLPGGGAGVDDAPAVGRTRRSVVFEVFGDRGGFVVVLQIDGDQFAISISCWRSCSPRKLMRSMTSVCLGGFRASQLRRARRSPSGRASTSVLTPGAGRSQSSQSRRGLSRLKCSLPSILEIGREVVTSSALLSGRHTGAAAPYSSLVTTCASPGPRSETTTPAVGACAYRIYAHEGQGSIIGTYCGRRIAAVPEGQLLGPGIGAVEVDAPQVSAVFVGRFTLGWWVNRCGWIARRRRRTTRRTQLRRW